MAWGDGKPEGNGGNSCPQASHPPTPLALGRSTSLCRRTSSGRALPQTGQNHRAEVLGLRFEDRVPLLAGLGYFPDTLEARGYDEGIACAQIVFLARDRLDAHAAFDDHAEFVLGVAHAPFAGGAGPDAAEELLSRLGVLIRCARPRNAGEYIFGRWIGRLSRLQSVQDDDLGVLTHALS